MTSLLKNFQARGSWINNRASCIFPIFTGEMNDTHLVFQNYWDWKNNIKKVFCIIRLRDSKGNKIFDTEIEIENHNVIKVGNLIEDKTSVNGGVVEIEIISPENLGYPFPAILAFYVTKEQKSVVHAAGRILNSNEAFKNNRWTESNFSTSFSDDFSPFICLFYGQYVEDNAEIKLVIKDYKNNSLLYEKTSLLKPCCFGSEVIYVKDLLSVNELKNLKNKKVYIIFDTEITGIFGRFVVGNLHLKTNQYFTTHSFQFINPDSKDIITSSENECSTFIPIFNKKPLRLKITSFPTNIQKKLTLKVLKSKINESLEKSNEFVNITTGGENASVFEYQLNDNGFMKLESYDDSPSRINANYNFSLENSLYSTDLATGFKANTYPPKTNHWGSSILDTSWKTVIFIRNLNHKGMSKETFCNFEGFTNEEVIIKDISVKPESCNILEISSEDFKKSSDQYFSWKITASEVTIEVFWVSYNQNNGAICAEHSF